MKLFLVTIYQLKPQLEVASKKLQKLKAWISTYKSYFHRACMQNKNSNESAITKTIFSRI